MGGVFVYSLMVVDDEQFVREGIVSSYNWHDYGFQVVNMAGNGKEALDIIKLKRPHVVLADIVMPEMDGLEFSKQVNLLYPEVNVVLLSAHKDFEFAQRAIAFGVKGYLLKPIDPLELEKTFHALRIQLGESETKGGNDSESIETEHDLNTYSQYIKAAKQYVWDNSEYKITMEDISKKLYISAGYFGFIFKKETGVNFIDYVIEVKMAKAKKLLLSSNCKVKEIAAKVGYDDYTYFCKIFKKMAGCTPLEYRSMN